MLTCTMHMNWVHPWIDFARNGRPIVTTDGNKQIDERDTMHSSREMRPIEDDW